MLVFMNSDHFAYFTFEDIYIINRKEFLDGHLFIYYVGAKLRTKQMIDPIFFFGENFYDTPKVWS